MQGSVVVYLAKSVHQEEEENSNGSIHSSANTTSDWLNSNRNSEIKNYKS